MDTNDLIPTLALATLIIAVLAAVIGYMLFKRKPANQHPMDQSRDDGIATVRTKEPR
ncbi:hypothetical protein [Brevundimonas sp. R86498]|uniref:hypothetical protein n=1 Tax=Brevundimonas sp. R86498 TaxID=3093845 RepID=UPI0037CB9DFD